MPILSALDAQQRAAAECVSGPVVIYAGAGTGKTRTITHRIAHGVASGVYEPTQTLAVTFTTRAAGELRSRLTSLGVNGVQVRTFHSAALRQLRFFHAQVFDKPMPTLVPSKFRFVSEAANLCAAPNDQDTIRDIASEIEWAKVNIMSPSSYRDYIAEGKRSVGTEVKPELIAKVYEAYLSVLDDHNVMDFEDVLLYMTAIMANFPEVADQVRRQYRYFTVDEFQDVSPAQFELLSLWLGNRRDLCVVGDPAQTIYSFSGATSNYLTKFSDYFQDASHFELGNSYRSTTPIINVANAVIAKQASVELKSVRGNGPKVSLEAYSHDEAEAVAVAEEIRSLINSGTAARDIAVLFRVNSQSALIEAELGNRGVAYTLRGAERFFERPEVKNAVLSLRATAAGTIDNKLGAIVRDVLSGSGWRKEMPDAGRAAQETWESLNTLVDLADEFALTHTDATVRDFVAHLDERNDQEHAPTANAVTLASIHAAKGLEWDSVFVIGLSDGLLPISRAKTPAAHLEERRLLYVAVTRAKNNLFLSWAKARHSDGKAHRSPSPFLADLSL